MILRHRSDERRLARERDQPDAITRGTVDQAQDGGLRGVEAVRFAHVLGQHAFGNIQRDHQVHAGPLDLDLAMAKQRTRQTHEQRHDRQQPERGLEFPFAVIHRAQQLLAQPRRDHAIEHRALAPRTPTHEQDARGHRDGDDNEPMDDGEFHSGTK